MSISSQIIRIAKNVSDSLDAVAAKGVTVPAGADSDDLPGLIAQISGGGTGAISIVDTADAAGGTVRTITAVDISDTTAIASDVASGKYFYTADGTKTAGTATGGTVVVTDVSNTTGTTAAITADSSTTAHSIYLEFSDSTNTTIPVYYTNSLIGTMITAYQPTTWTYNNKTVVLAKLDGVTWYDKTVTWTTIYDGVTTFTAEPEENDSYAWVTDLGSYAITENSMWRVTWGETVRTHEAVYGPPFEGATTVWHINSLTDGTNGDYVMYNMNNVAWIFGDFVDMSSHSKYVKIEQAVTT